jgi:hypothetical protein
MPVNQPPPQKIPEHFNQAQRDGLACVHCGRQSEPMRPAQAWQRNFSSLSECADRDACTDLLLASTDREETAP